MLKKWWVHVCGKRRGVELHIDLGLEFDFCFTSFETFFLDFKKFRIIFNYFYAQNRGVRFC